MRLRLSTFGVVVLVLVWAALAVPQAAATDFYVSSIHANRSDSNAGTSPNAPWATFNKIKQRWGSTIQAGDTVHLERGSTWTWSADYGYWWMTSGGNASQGAITIRGDDYGSGSQPVLRKVGGGTGDTFVITEGASYITLRDFTVDGGSAAGLDTGGVVVGGQDHSGPISHINILNMVFRNLGDGSSVYICGVYLAPHNRNTISDCLIEGNDISGYTSHGLNHYPGKEGTAKVANTLHNVTWRNNYVHDPAANRFSGVGSGMQIQCGGNGNIFEYNLVDGPNMTASIFIANCSNDEDALVVRHNVLKNNSIGQGLLVYGGGDAAQGTQIDAEIYGNIITGARSHGFNMESGNRFSGTFKIYNNTFYDNNTQYDFDSEIKLSPDNDNITVDLRNNLIVHKASLGSCFDVSSAFDGSLTHSHNLFWHTSGSSRTAIKMGGSSYTVANAKTFEPTAQNSNPSLAGLSQPPTSVSSTAGATPDGFAPEEDSPAVNNGTDLGGVVAGSIDLVSRPQDNAWDIGAYEFGVTEDVPKPPQALSVGP